MKNKLDLTGRKFGKFTVIKQRGADKRGATLWECLCSCGNVSIVRGTCLTRGGSLQCRHCVNTTHGKSATNIYKVWQGMKTRCTNTKAINFDNYGGRGISYDSRWEQFDNFYQDMGESYQWGLTLDRKDNSKGYSRENCKWVTPGEQNKNMRCNVYIEYHGGKLSAEAIAEMTGLTRAAIYNRHRRGWSGERIINTPMISKEEPRRRSHAQQ